MDSGSSCSLIGFNQNNSDYGNMMSIFYTFILLVLKHIIETQSNWNKSENFSYMRKMERRD